MKNHHIFAYESSQHNNHISRSSSFVQSSSMLEREYTHCVSVSHMLETYLRLPVIHGTKWKRPINKTWITSSGCWVTSLFAQSWNTNIWDDSGSHFYVSSVTRAVLNGQESRFILFHHIKWPQCDCRWVIERWQIPKKEKVFLACTLLRFLTAAEFFGPKILYLLDDQHSPILHPSIFAAICLV